MELNAFLGPIYQTYMTQHKPLELRSQLQNEIASLRSKIAELETQLATSGASEDDIKKFLVNAEELMGGHATETMLINMLVAKFGGAVEEEPKRGKRGRGKKKDKVALLENESNEGEAEAEDAPGDEVTPQEKELILQVLTRESMSVTEVAEATSVHTGDEWLAADVSPILRALIKDGKVITEGERRGKRYMLAA